eukprot:m51a1_g12775 hypothetical protein (372) ;mRNA; f:1596-3543
MQCRSGLSSPAPRHSVVLFTDDMALELALYLSLSIHRPPEGITFVIMAGHDISWHLSATLADVLVAGCQQIRLKDEELARDWGEGDSSAPGLASPPGLSLDELPRTALARVVSYLPSARDLLSCSLACRAWHRALLDPSDPDTLAMWSVLCCDLLPADPPPAEGSSDASTSSSSSPAQRYYAACSERRCAACLAWLGLPKYRCTHCQGVVLCAACAEAHPRTHLLAKERSWRPLRRVWPAHGPPTRLTCAKCGLAGEKLRTAFYARRDDGERALCAACFRGSGEDPGLFWKVVGEPLELLPAEVVGRNERYARCDIRAQGVCLRSCTGVRWKCSVCSNYDLCEKCEALGTHPDTHPLIKVYWTRLDGIPFY